MLYHACSYTHFCRMPYVCCSQWDAYCCLPKVRDPNNGRLVSLGNLTLANGGVALPDRVPAQQLRHLVSMWNMWYFWFMLIFLLFVCFGVCGVHKRRAAWASAAASSASTYRGGGDLGLGLGFGGIRSSAGSRSRRSLLMMDWAPRLPRFPPPMAARRSVIVGDLPDEYDDEIDHREAGFGRSCVRQSQSSPAPPPPPPPPPPYRPKDNDNDSAAGGSPPAYCSNDASPSSATSQAAGADASATVPPPPPYRPRD